MCFRSDQPPFFPAQSVCFLNLAMNYIVKFLSASWLVTYNGMGGHAPLRAFQTGGLLPPHLSFSWPPSSIKQVLPFNSDLIRPHDLCPAWTDPWREPPSPGIVLLAAPSDWHGPHSRPPFTIHSDFVQLVNLASPPCWELRQRKREEDGGSEEEKVEEEGAGGRGSLLRNEGERRSLYSFFSSNLFNKRGASSRLNSYFLSALHFIFLNVSRLS